MISINKQLNELDEFVNITSRIKKIIYNFDINIIDIQDLYNILYYKKKLVIFKRESIENKDIDDSVELITKRVNLILNSINEDTYNTIINRKQKYNSIFKKKKYIDIVNININQIDKWMTNSNYRFRHPFIGTENGDIINTEYDLHTEIEIIKGRLKISTGINKLDALVDIKILSEKLSNAIEKENEDILNNLKIIHK